MESCNTMSQSYKNLKIWVISVELATGVYRLTKFFPKEELFGTVSQLRRAVISISSNIAEGSSRPSKKDYSRFIDIAIGSLHETESLLEISSRLGYLSKGDYAKIKKEIETLGVLIGGFKKYLNKK